VYCGTLSDANLATITGKRLSTAKVGKPCDRFMALCWAAIFDIMEKMLVPIVGSFNIATN
jgi:hypothetical protein